MSQNVVLKASGLYSFPNLLGSIPNGALLEAINVVIDRNDVLEPRRGFGKFGSEFGVGADRAKQLLVYKDRVLVHYDSKLAFDSNGSGSFSDFSGTYSETQSGLRIKSIESNGNLYFTTSEGVKRISAGSAADFTTSAGFIEQAGGIKALDPECIPDYSQAGFFQPISKVAYRVVWGKTDLNNNLILGAVSARAVVENSSTSDSCVVSIEFPIPDDINSENFFYQIYRTAVFTAPTLGDLADLDPGDEMYLVLEDFVTSAEITAGSVSVLDITPEDFRQNGALLYTNPVSGQGIEQNNEPPPFAKDITLYKNITFYANTFTRQRLNLSQLSILDLISGTSTLSFSDGVTTRTYTYTGTIETYTADFSLMTFPGGKAALDGNYFTIIAANDSRKYKVWFDNTGSTTEPTLAGYIPIKIDISATADTAAAVATKTKTDIESACIDFNIDDNTGSLDIKTANNGNITTVVSETIGASFSITQDGLGTGEDTATQKIFLPRVPSLGENGPTTAQQIDESARSLIRVLNADPSGLVYAYYLSNFNDVPGQMIFERRTLTGGEFWITANSALTGGEFNPAIPTSGTSVISENEENPNRIYFSKYQQPDAVPLVNYVDIGPKDDPILRAIALRDSVLVFKRDGIYRITGDSSPFSIYPLDNSASLLAADTATILNNQVYGFSTQGVITVSDTGVSVISRPIENTLLSVIRDGFNYATASFGVGYETDRAYLLFLPTVMNDTYATQCFRYNVFTNSWTKWDISKRCGIVNRSNDKLYLGPVDENFIEQERKNRDRTDHADRDYLLSLLVDGINVNTPNIIELSSISDVTEGDVLFQRQYLTLFKFNQLLQQLDSDSFLTDNDYYSTLQLYSGQSVTDKLNSLVTKLTADDTTPITQTFVPADVNTGTDEITIVGHGFTDAKVVTFTTTGTLPGGISTLTPYYIISSTANTFQLSLTEAGTPINITSAGSGTHTITADYTFTGTTSITQIQTEFNIIVKKLNKSDGTFFSNYSESSNYTDYEARIYDFDRDESTVTIASGVPFLAGDITLYKGFNSRVTWAPQHFGDPSMMKQVREGTIIFEDNNFSDASVAYSSDLSPGFASIDFSGAGLGDFGLFGWGEQNWGGVSSAKPLRTLIPRQKQRCRYLNCRFEHQAAYEKFSIFGISLTFRPISERAYK